MQTCGRHGLHSAAAPSGCGGGSRMQATPSRQQPPELTLVATLTVTLPTRHQQTQHQRQQVAMAGPATQRLWDRLWQPQPHLTQVSAC